MRALLSIHGLWSITSGTLTRNIFLGNYSGAALARRKRNWQIRCGRACGIILLHISENLLLEFTVLGNPARLWAEIRQRYRETLPDEESLQNTFWQTTVYDMGTVEAFIARLKKLYFDLNMIDEHGFSYEFLLEQLLQGAPYKWDIDREKIEEQQDAGKDTLGLITGCLLRCENQERRRRRIPEGEPLFLNSLYADEWSAMTQIKSITSGVSSQVDLRGN